MIQPVALLLGVHAHQPVGNFPKVIAEAHERCYRPFLQTLHRYPTFRFAAHFSGWLLDFLCTHYPQDMALLDQMVRRGQTELFGGGECEPVLAAIPVRDRVGQVEALSAQLTRRFGRAPKGAWLTERVWEATVVPALVDAGIDYAMVDDYHFLCTGIDADRLDSYYSTEEDGRALDLFPISEALRYRLPFSPAADAVRYLEEQAERGSAAAIYFDDIEKFGIWPETYAWVYERKWLEQFIEGVLASPRIRTMSYGDFHAGRRTRGIVYLPSTSYSEMSEWTLPRAAAECYDDLLQREKQAGTLAQHRPFLRGGIWRNFFSRYAEANWMHKRMLALSQRLARIGTTHAAAAGDGALRQLLYRAQANDAYWHGLFGGLYLPHLRRSVYGHLLRLEAALDALEPPPTRLCIDLDRDGKEELFLRGAEVQAVLRVDGLASIIEFDSYPLAQNFGDTLRRHEEAYYRKIGRAQEQQAAGEGIASPHDRVDFKHVIVAADIIPDETPRAIFIDRWVDGQGRRTLLDNYTAVDEQRYRASGNGWTLDKRLELGSAEITASYRCAGTPPAGLECEINLAMPSCDGYSGRYILTDGSIPCGFGQTLELADCVVLSLDDRELKGRIVLRSNRPVRLRGAPHHSVSQSEAGFEKIMQCVCLTLAWSPTAGEAWSISIGVVVDGNEAIATGA